MEPKKTTRKVAKKVPKQTKLGFNADLSLNPFSLEHSQGLFDDKVAKKETVVDLYEEKYKPKTMKEYVGNKAAVKSLKSHLRDTKKNKLIILHGPPGSGKTCVLDILLEGYQIIEFNSCDKLLIFDKIEKSLNNLSVVSTFLEGRPRIIVIDDIDKTIGDGVYYTKLLSSIQAQSNNCKVIATTTNLKKKFNTPTKVDIVVLEYPTTEEALKFCRKVASSEHLTISEKGMKTIITAAKYDFRKILHTFKLLSFRSAGDKLKHKDILSVINFSEADSSFTAYEIVEEAFSGEYPEESEKLIDYCYSDQNTVMDLLYSNLSVGKMDLEDISSCLDSIAMGDVFHHQMFQTQCWNLKEYSIVFGCLTPIHTINNRKFKSNGYINLKKNILNNFSLTRSKNKNIYLDINHKRKMATSYNITDIAYISKAIVMPQIETDENEETKNLIKNLVDIGITDDVYSRLRAVNFGCKVKPLIKKEKTRIGKMFSQFECTILETKTTKMQSKIQ
jgi:DNA polymerase III delta prime subunit